MKTYEEFLAEQLMGPVYGPGAGMTTLTNPCKNPQCKGVALFGADFCSRCSQVR